MMKKIYRSTSYKQFRFNASIKNVVEKKREWWTIMTKTKRFHLRQINRGRKVFRNQKKKLESRLPLKITKSNKIDLSKIAIFKKQRLRKFKLIRNTLKQYSQVLLEII